MLTQPLPTAAQVAAYLDWPQDSAEQIGPHLSWVTTYVRSYVRGVGFATPSTCAEDIAAVIVSATARSVNNPSQAVREEAGSWSIVPARFEGFTLVEQSVLHGYRRRTA